VIFDYLIPVSEKVIDVLSNYQDLRFGTSINIHTDKNVPEITKDVSIVIIGVQEDRCALNNEGTGDDFTIIREELYKLYLGNWHLNIVDLGNIAKGNSSKDTHFALQEVVRYLVKKNIIPLVIGGSQALTYSVYRAYDDLEQTVNLVSVDNKFDLGQLDSELNSRSFLSKIVMEEPNNLFNYSNIGYQTFFNSQEEIDLLKKLYFDTYRLGAVNQDISLVEPVLRDADIVSVDISALRKTEAPANNNTTPNGLYGEEMCAIIRYAGLSDKVSSIGIYEYNSFLDDKSQTAQLIAQMIWYFIEGVNFRLKEYPFGTKKEYIKYIVPIDNDVIVFYKSNKSNRWWMEIPNNKFKKDTLIPCTYSDYLEANSQNVPSRWWKTIKKIT